jgi:hypothetical protein
LRNRPIARDNLDFTVPGLHLNASTISLSLSSKKKRYPITNLSSSDNRLIAAKRAF